MTEFVSKMEVRIEGTDLHEEIKRSQSEIVVYAPKFEFQTSCQHDPVI